MIRELFFHELFKSSLLIGSPDCDEETVGDTFNKVVSLSWLLAKN